MRNKIACLELSETGAFNQAAWPTPELSEFGLAISRNAAVARTYAACATELREAVSPFIEAAENVFTHNPWGEYGHEEHIMVHRVVTTEAAQSDIPVWHTNYVSGWSQSLMENYFSITHAAYYENAVNGDAMSDVAKIYKKHGAWTWMDDFHWFPQECYIQGPLSQSDSADGGWLCPVNFMRLPGRPATAVPVKLSLQEKMRRKLARNIRKLRVSKSRGN
jgi:hypothetical protein